MSQQPCIPYPTKHYKSLYVITQNVTFKPTYGLRLILIANTNFKTWHCFPSCHWAAGILKYEALHCPSLLHWITFQGMFLLASPNATFHSINITSLPKWCWGYSKTQICGKRSGTMIKLCKVLKRKNVLNPHMNTHENKVTLTHKKQASFLKGSVLF